MLRRFAPRLFDGPDRVRLCVQLIGAGEEIDLDGQDLEVRIIGYPRFDHYLIVMLGPKVLGGEDQRYYVEHQAERLARYYLPEARVYTVIKDAAGNLRVVAA